MTLYGVKRWCLTLTLNRSDSSSSSVVYNLTNLELLGNPPHDQKSTTSGAWEWVSLGLYLFGKMMITANDFIRREKTRRKWRVVSTTCALRRCWVDDDNDERERVTPNEPLWMQIIKKEASIAQQLHRSTLHLHDQGIYCPQLTHLRLIPHGNSITELAAQALSCMLLQWNFITRLLQSRRHAIFGFRIPSRPSMAGKLDCSNDDRASNQDYKDGRHASSS